MLLRFLDIAHDYDTQAVDDDDDDGGIDDGVNDDDIDVGGIFFFQTLVSGDGDGDDDDGDIDDGEMTMTMTLARRLKRSGSRTSNVPQLLPRSSTSVEKPR